MKTEKDKDEHARSNARGWSETIAALVAALECDFDRLQELRDECATCPHCSEAIAINQTTCPHCIKRVDADLAAARKELAELVAAATVDGDEFKEREHVEQRIQESPLSVQVRSDWYSPGAKPEAPEEFEVLLSTGGPALRIMGELDEHCQPHRAWLEYQDWGTPWTEFHGEGAPSQDVLLTFCQQFYFGE